MLYFITGVILSDWMILHDVFPLSIKMIPVEAESDRHVVPQSVGHSTLSFYFLFCVTVKDD